MIQIDQLHKDISALPDDAQHIVAELVEFLKYKHFRKTAPTAFDPMQFSGSIKWDIDGLEYQEKVRADWE